MAEKILKTRVQLKNDIEANWNTSNFIPKQGEIIIYNPDSTNSSPRIKIGDGIKSVPNLPFITGTEPDITLTVENEILSFN